MNGFLITKLELTTQQYESRDKNGFTIFTVKCQSVYLSTCLWVNLSTGQLVKQSTFL